MPGAQRGLHVLGQRVTRFARGTTVRELFQQSGNCFRSPRIVSRGRAGHKSGGVGPTSVATVCYVGFRSRGSARAVAFVRLMKQFADPAWIFDRPISLVGQAFAKESPPIVSGVRELFHGTGVPLSPMPRRPVRLAHCSMRSSNQKPDQTFFLFFRREMPHARSRRHSVARPMPSVRDALPACHPLASSAAKICCRVG